MRIYLPESTRMTSSPAILPPAPCYPPAGRLVTSPATSSLLPHHLQPPPPPPFSSTILLSPATTFWLQYRNVVCAICCWGLSNKFYVQQEYSESR